MIRIVIGRSRMLLGALGSLLNMKMIWKLSEWRKREEAVNLVREHQPMCIMDIEMPVKTGLDAAEELKGAV